MLVHLYSAAVNGLIATPVEVEVNTYPGDKLQISGLPDASVRESYSRVTSAIQNSGFRQPATSLIINLAPAGLRKVGSGYDLPIAIAMLASMKAVLTERFEKIMMVGELGLDGSLRPVLGALSIAIEARKRGFDALIVPKANEREAGVVNRLKVYGARHLSEVIDLLNGKPSLQPADIDTRGEFLAAQNVPDNDFRDVRGQENVKRAFEVAAAGGHNIILVGSPGCGKSMMAKRMPSILPPLTLAESLETTQIHSVAGILPSDVSLISQRPFRSPHHTISDVGICGGGSNFRPGEVSLAHNGVLFLDELPEFSKTVLETLRQPLEDRVITISRAQYSIQLPCSIMLVAAMNPCPCGYYNDPNHHCDCTPGQIKRYMSRVSGPFLDRMDLQIEVTPVPLKDLTQMPQGESSAQIRERVIAARSIQSERFKDNKGIYCNAQMSARMIQQYAKLDENSERLLAVAMTRLGLSARAYERILKMARTIADLEASPSIQGHHIREAISYRNLDRSTWGE